VPLAKEALSAFNAGAWTAVELYTKWQWEYWQTIDYVDMLERQAGELEARYLKLVEITGGDREAARKNLAERYTRLVEGHKIRDQRRMARMEEKERRIGAEIRARKDTNDPILQLQAGLQGIPLD
jgi:hypothetical protein